MKTLPLIIFGIAALAQWVAPLSQIWTRERILTQGTLIKLKCSAPDPYDPLRGRFLAVRPEQAKATMSADTHIVRGAQIYITLTPGTDGLSTITAMSRSLPTSSTYLRVRAIWVHDKEVTISWPFDRFYLNEKLAPEADKWFAENIRSTKGIIAEVRVLNGRAVLENLSLDGKSFRELLKERMK